MSGARHETRSAEPRSRACQLRVAGARVAEARLLAELERALDDPDTALSRLSRPLRVVVPSRSLRDHVAAAIVRRRGRAALGVVVQTHRAAAFDVLERSGFGAPGPPVLLPVFVRRFAREEPALREALDGLADGYGVVESAVRDFLDAGFEPAHAPALFERLEAMGGRAAARAHAVVRVVAGVAERLDRGGFGDGSTSLRLATAALARGGAELLPTSGLWVHGFADATGVVADWLSTLIRVFEGRIGIVFPPDPGDGSRREREFAERLAERLVGVAPPEPSVESGVGEGDALALVAAPGARAEARAVAARVRRLLDAGVEPESVGVVLREPAASRGPFCVQLEQLGIPYSAPGLDAPSVAGAPEARALLALLERRGRTPLDTWLDLGPGRADPDVRLALHALGAARLQDLADRRLDAALEAPEGVALPVRCGIVAAEDDAEEHARPRRPRRRRVSRDRLARVLARGRDTLERLGGWPDPGPAAAQLQALRALLDAERVPDPAQGAPVALREAADALEAELPATFELTAEELALLLRRELEGSGRVRIGGAGAGVQLLSVMEARGRTFAHLFLAGMNRDVFPRAIVDDPLLPDSVRRRVAELLPDLPIKERGRAEERHLFADLVSASPHVTLSWQAAGDDGRERAVSPFVVRLRLARPELEYTVAPALNTLPGPEAPEGAVPRTAHEHARLVALHGDAAQLAEVFPVASEEARAALVSPASPVEAPVLARARLAVLREVEPALDGARRAPRARAGPYLGLIGPRAVPRDRSVPEIYVTRLEEIALCPWRSFLRRELGLEPRADALEAFGALDPALLGRLVHRTLERWVCASAPDRDERLDVLFERGPVSVPWPSDCERDRLLEEEAAGLLAEEGLRQPGLERLLAHRARPLLDVARRVDEPAGGAPPAVFGAEVEGEFVLPDEAGRPRRIGFRADRAELHDERLVLTDFKTGRLPTSFQVGAARRARKLREYVRSGRMLQTAAYLEAARRLTDAVEGRFVYLGAGEPGDPIEIAAFADDAALREAFLATCRVLLSAIDAGVALPRLEDPDENEPRSCSRCEVRDACLRGESTHRRRLREWMRSVREAGEGVSDTAERAAVALFFLGSAPSADSGPSADSS